MTSITFAAHAPAKFIGFDAFGPTDGLIPSDHRFWTAKFIADGAALTFFLRNREELVAQRDALRAALDAVQAELGESDYPQTPADIAPPSAACSCLDGKHDGLCEAMVDFDWARSSSEDDKPTQGDVLLGHIDHAFAAVDPIFTR